MRRPVSLRRRSFEEFAVHRINKILWFVVSLINKLK